MKKDAPEVINRRKSTDALASVLLATLCLIPIWRELQALYAPEYRYHMAPTSPWPVIWTMHGATAILGALCFALLRWQNSAIEPRWRAVRSAIVLVLSAWPILQVARFVLGESAAPTGGLRAAIEHAPVVLALTLAAVCVWRRTPRLFDELIQLAAIFSVVFPILVLNLAWQYPHSAGSRPPESLAASPPANRRLILVVFDGWDAGITSHAEADGDMPELTAMRARSTSYTQAYSTSEETLVSVPSILTGRKLLGARAAGVGRLEIRLDASPTDWVQFKQQSHLPSALRMLGVHSAVGGWYHPYCALFDGSADACMDAAGLQAHPREHLIRSRGVAFASLLFAAEALPIRVLLNVRRPDDAHRWFEGPFSQAQRESMIASYRNIHRFALEATGRADIGFVFLHYPMPHPPGIFSERTRTFATSDEATYRGTLLLVDRTIGELRARLRQSGLDANTALIVTSDHQYRPNTWKSGVWMSSLQEAPSLAAQSGKTVPLVMEWPQDRKRTVAAPYSLTALYRVALDWIVAGRNDGVKSQSGVILKRRPIG